MRMPGFTVTASPCRTRGQHQSLPIQSDSRRENEVSDVIPQLPIRVGVSCGPCIPTSPGSGLGLKECCTLYCGTRYPFACWRSCKSEGCHLLLDRWL
jgi:hypothetical protein